MYTTADAAVSLRLLLDVAVTVEDETPRRRLVERGRKVVDGCRGRLTADELVRLERRQAALERLCPGETPST
jgi:hypothetical protein